MTYRQQSLWEEPAAGTVVKDGAGRQVQHPDGRITTRRGISHTWLLCDRCGCGSFVKGLPPDQDRLGDEEYRKSHGAPCRTGPKGCGGRHLVAKEPE